MEVCLSHVHITWRDNVCLQGRHFCASRWLFAARRPWHGVVEGYWIMGVGSSVLSIEGNGIEKHRTGFQALETRIFQICFPSWPKAGERYPVRMFV